MGPYVGLVYIEPMLLDLWPALVTVIPFGPLFDPKSPHLAQMAVFSMYVLYYSLNLSHLAFILACTCSELSELNSCFYEMGPDVGHMSPHLAQVDMS